MKLVNVFVISILLVSCSVRREWKEEDLGLKEGLHDIEIIDDQTKIMYSYGTGNIYRSTNNGESWANIFQFDSIYFEQLQFLDKNTGWIVGSRNKIYKTENGGTNWIDKSLGKKYAKALIYGMHFEDKNKGYVAALKTSNREFYSVILKTEDSGNTWEPVNKIREMILNLEKIDGVLYGTGNDVVIKNIDSKDKWEYAFCDPTGKVGQIRDIEKNEENKVLGVSFNGYIIDLSSKKQKTIKITENHLRSLTSLDKGQWFVVGDKNKEAGNLFISEDNGDNWETDANDFADIHRIEKSDKKLWIVGKDGLVMTLKK